MRAALARMPLTLRAALVVAALMVLLGLIASQQVLMVLNWLQNERIREFASEHVEALSVALGPLALQGDVWGIYDTLERAASALHKGRVGFMAVADAGGKVLAATDPRRAPVGSDIAGLLADAQSLEGLRLPGAGARLRIASPIVFQGREVARIVSDLDVGDLLAERRRVAWLLVAWNAGATLLLAVVGALLIRRMIAPVALVAERMSSSAGAPEPIPAEMMPAPGGAFGGLARTYNAMAGAVSQKAEWSGASRTASAW